MSAHAVRRRAVDGSVSAPAAVVREVRSSADRRRFLALPYRLHRGDPLWVPPLRREVAKLLSPANPFFEHGAAALFLAEREGRAVARVAAVENRAHNEFHGDRVGFFGFFEAEDDPAAVAAVLDAAAEWLRARGLTHMRGPCSLSTNDECGVVVDGFDEQATVLTPNGPRSYPGLLEGAGLEKAKDLYLHCSDAGPLPERLVRSARVVARRNDVTLRAMDVKRFDEEIALVKRIYHGAWEKNWGFVPMTESELDHMASELKPIVVPDLVVFAECGGELAGFAVALPDFNVALRANRSGRLFPGVFGILWRARKIDRCRILLLGLLPEFRGRGIDALMYQWIWEKSMAHGMTWGEAGWVLEDNAAMNNALGRIGFRHYRTLRLYEKAL